MPKVVVMSAGKEEVFDLTADITSVGRGLDNNIVLQDIKSSRKHCQIVKSATDYILKDLDSGNGTFVNGQRIKEYALKEGNQIKIGSTLIVFTNKSIAAKPSIPTGKPISPTQPSVTQVSKADTMRFPIIADTTKVSAQAPPSPQKSPQPLKPTTKVLQPVAQQAVSPTAKVTQPPTKNISQATVQNKPPQTQAIRNNSSQPTPAVKPPTSRRVATATATPVTRTTKRIGTSASKPSARFQTSAFPQRKKMSAIVKISLFACLIFIGAVGYIILSKPSGPTEEDETKVTELYANLTKDTGPIGNQRHYDKPDTTPEERIKYRRQLYEAYENFLKEVLDDPICKQTKAARRVIADIRSRSDKLIVTCDQQSMLLFDIINDKGEVVAKGWGTKEKEARKEAEAYLDKASQATKETARAFIDQGESLITKYSWTTFEFKLRDKVKKLKDIDPHGTITDMEKVRRLLNEVNNNELKGPKKNYAEALKKIRELLPEIQDENPKKTLNAKISDVESQASNEYDKLIEEADNKIKKGSNEEALKLLQDEAKRFEGTSSAEKLNNKVEEISKSLKKVQAPPPPQKKDNGDKKPEEPPQEQPPPEEPPKEG